MSWTLASVDAVWGRRRVLADHLPGRRGAFEAWYELHGEGVLHHRPDVVLVDWHGPRTFLVLDFKTLDVAGPTWLHTRHTDRVRCAAQTEAERRCRVLQFRVTPQTPLPPRFRLVVFAVSTFGSFGDEAQRFLSEVARRCGRALPVDLLPQATWGWAAPALAPFARMAVAFAVRRGLAQRLSDRWRPGAGLGGAEEPANDAPWEGVDDVELDDADADDAADGAAPAGGAAGEGAGAAGAAG